MSRYSNSVVLVAPGQPNGQGQGDGAGAWAERWDKGEGAMGWGGDLGQGGARAWVKGGGARAWVGGDILISPRNILRGIL